MLTTTTIVFESPQRGNRSPFRIVANCYTQGTAPEGGITLILAHANGTHKEHWEPTLQRLFGLQLRLAGLHYIQAAWAIDAPSHGDSAMLNSASINEREDVISISEYGEAIATLMRSDHIRGKRVVIIGHSAGCSACMYSTKLFPQEKIPYEAIILVEPPLIDRAVFNENIQDREVQISYLTKSITHQRSTWDTKEMAYEWLAKRIPWKSWDKRVLQIYVSHGLRRISEDSDKVTTKCDKIQEAKAYRDFEPTFEALDQIAQVCKEVPIHVVFGGVNDLVPRYSQDSVIDISKGRKITSVGRIPGVGHMIVQQNPDALADYIYKLLNGNTFSRL